MREYHHFCGVITPSNTNRGASSHKTDSIFQLQESLGQTNRRKEFVSCASINTNQICDENSENLHRVSIETLELTRSLKLHPKQLYQMLEKPLISAFKLDSLKRHTLAGKIPTVCPEKTKTNHTNFKYSKPIIWFIYGFLNWKRNLHRRNDIVLSVETSKSLKIKINIDPKKTSAKKRRGMNRNKAFGTLVRHNHFWRTHLWANHVRNAFGKTIVKF